jgi:hypothetical protein
VCGVAAPAVVTAGVVPTGAAAVAGVPAAALPTAAGDAGAATGIEPAEVVAGVTTSFAVTAPLTLFFWFLDDVVVGGRADRLASQARVATLDALSTSLGWSVGDV